MEKIGLKAPGNYSAWFNDFRFAYGRKTHHFYDFGIFGRSPTPQTKKQQQQQQLFMF